MEILIYGAIGPLMAIALFISVKKAEGLSRERAKRQKNRQPKTEPEHRTD